MRTSTAILFSVLMLGASLARCAAAAQTQTIGAIEGVSHASIHVLFDTTRPLPVAGTFDWGVSMLRVGPSIKATLSEVTDRLHHSLLATLPAKGFTFTNQAPDYLVSFAVLAGASLDEAELNRAYGKLLKFPARTDAASSLTYEPGVLILDLVQRRDGHLLWRGAIKADLDLTLPDEKKQARCDGSIRELLRHYPRP